MPELPEVQTIVNELNRKIKNKIIRLIEVRNSRSALPSPKVLINKIKNKKIQKISGGHSIANLGILPNKFSHIIIHFADSSILYFNDIRKFGWVKYATNIEWEAIKQKYGLEPFDKEYTLENFTNIIKSFPKRKIKQLLMDQEKFSGIGNIYADESLFSAKILPFRLAGSLTNQEIKNLYQAIPKILKLAIRHGGTTADNYVRTDGSKGEMIKFLKVYGRTEKKCKRCGGIISKIKLNGRGTHFCQTCQK